MMGVGDQIEIPRGLNRIDTINHLSSPGLAAVRAGKQPIADIVLAAADIGDIALDAADDEDINHLRLLWGHGDSQIQVGARVKSNRAIAGVELQNRLPVGP